MKIPTLVFAVLFVAAAGCGKRPCSDLQKAVCKAAPDTKACRSASHLTNDDECNGYLKDVDKYVKLTNQVADKPGVKPPAPEAAPPAARAPEPESPATEPVATAAANEAPAATGEPEKAVATPKPAPAEGEKKPE